MYITITTKCQLLCKHCCNNSGPSGRHMPKATFVAACKLAADYGGDIFLGGGEPTMHPEFWEFLGIALRFADPDGGGVGVITNGLNEDDAIAIARLGRAGVIFAGVSNDNWHPRRPSERVIKAFTRPDPRLSWGNGTPYDKREVRTGTNHHVFAAGRAKGFGSPGCVCPDIVIWPNGTIYACGCRDRVLGNVNTGDFEAPTEWGVCVHEDERINELIGG